MLFTSFSCLWVISLQEDKINSAKLSPLSALEKLIPQHEVQLLNANFSDQLHYDQLAQLQSEVEALVFEASVSDTSEQLLKKYNETSLSYSQLSSMLKTSQRLISENFQFENGQIAETIDDILLNMFSFISSPDNTDKATLIERLNSIDISDRQQDDWQHLQLVKLHSLFILENYELTAINRRNLIEMPVVEAINQERDLLQQEIKKTSLKQFVGLSGAIAGLVLLAIVVIRRNQHAMKKSSKLHEDFATNLMDMLGPDIEKLQAKQNDDKIPLRNRKTGR